MSNKDILLLAVVGVGAVMYLNRKRAPTQIVSRPTSQNANTTNVNGDMWSKLLGVGWNALMSSNGDGSSPFTMKNAMGQDVTSDGKPVYGDLANQIILGNTPDYLGALDDLAGGFAW
jgi:hypothetical protein